MRWRLLATRNGLFVLFHDGDPLLMSDDLGLVLSLFGDLTNQNVRARVS